jgi:hypothetical protein
MLTPHTETVELFSKKVLKQYVKNKYGVTMYAPPYSRVEMEDLKLSIDLLKANHDCDGCDTLQSIELLPEDE